MRTTMQTSFDMWLHPLLKCVADHRLASRHLNYPQQEQLKSLGMTRQSTHAASALPCYEQVEYTPPSYPHRQRSHEIILDERLVRRCSPPWHPPCASSNQGFSLSYLGRAAETSPSSPSPCWPCGPCVLQEPAELMNQYDILG